MTYDEIKVFIKENLVIETENPTFGRSNSVRIQLRFKDDAYCFSEDVIYIPDDPEN